QEPGEKGGAHAGPVFDDRILQSHKALRSIIYRKSRNQFELIVVRRADETEADGLVAPACRQSVAQRALASLGRVIFAGETRRRKPSRDLVVAGVARDFLNQVFFDGDVVTPGRNCKRELCGPIVSKFKP